MNAFFDSLKSDLFDRRLTPVLALLGAALLGAIVYAVLGGGSSSPAPAASASVAVPKTSGIEVTAVAAAKTSAAETTSGAAEQTGGGATRNPFRPLPGVKPASAATSASASGSSAGSSTSSSGTSGEGSSGSSSEGSGSEGSGSQTNSSPRGGGTQSQEKKSSKPGKAYKVSVLFGTAPAGTPVLSAGLTSYEDLKRQQPLPSTTRPLIVFRGVIAGGKSATFTLVGEAILRGSAACLPNASQCQAIDLKVGDTEELEYVPLGGTSVTYELHVVKIEAIKAKAAAKAGKGAKVAKVAAVADVTVGESRTGLKLLREYGLMAVPGLRYSRDGRVLVFRGTGHALAARAHASAWGAAFQG